MNWLKSAVRAMLIAAVAALLVATAFVLVFGPKTCDICKHRYNAILDGDYGFEAEFFDSASHEMIKYESKICPKCWEGGKGLDAQPEPTPADSAVEMLNSA